MTPLDGMRSELRRIADMPMGAATTLPGKFYTDPAHFELETAQVLEHAWHCAGRSDEIPGDGDYFTLTILGEPLLVVRGGDGVIRVLSNVCRHRGMPIARGRGRTKLFVCSYHAWSYKRDGTLARAPSMENTGFDPATCKLPEFLSEVWNGFIYVNLSATASPLAPRLAGLDRLLANYDTPSLRLVHTEEEIWRTNWKCLIENFMEGYHLSVVHPKTLHDYTPTRLSKKAASGPAFTSYLANYPETIPPRGRGAANLTSEERHRSTLFSVFPTQVASQSASLLVSLNLNPLKVDETNVRWTMSVYGDDLADDVIAQRIALWQEVNREDREKLELLQLALSARATRDAAGPLADEDMEGTIHDFHRYLADAWDATG